MIAEGVILKFDQHGHRKRRSITREMTERHSLKSTEQYVPREGALLGWIRFEKSGGLISKARSQLTTCFYLSGLTSLSLLWVKAEQIRRVQAFESITRRAVRSLTSELALMKQLGLTPVESWSLVPELRFPLYHS